jgi:CRISPR-associated Csx11 family protein
MVGTVYSQSFEDWFYGEKKKKENNIWIMRSTIQLLRDAGVNEIIQPTKETIYFLLGEVLKNLNKDKKKAAKILDTFFQDVNITKKLLDQHIKNIKERIGASSLTKENLAAYLFTQNPSPARLYRIWRETEEFFDLVIKEIKDKIYRNKWKRVIFYVKDKNFTSQLEHDTTYLIKINGLDPRYLLVLHTQNGEFYTIESLGKFRFNNKTGEEAVREALKKGFKHITLEDEPDINLLPSSGEEIKPDENSIKVENYCPIIEITKSPLSLRLIVPALDSMKIIESVTKLYDERFKKVLGKLPLNVKLLVAKRKFPLYILLDAENRMLEGEEFKKQMPMTPWWDVNGMRNDRYYGFYPIKSIKENEKYTLDDLSPISKGKIFRLYPGYFDFDLLLGTTDRYNIYYKGRKREGEDYKLFTGRPYYFYQISEILELWDVLSNLPSSQINFIEEILTSKLREWRNVEDGNKRNIFRGFAEATLKDAFGDKWNGLREETRFFLVNSALNGLLLDTIILFRHVIKKEVNEYE